MGGLELRAVPQRSRPRPRTRHGSPSRPARAGPRPRAGRSELHTELPDFGPAARRRSRWTCSTSATGRPATTSSRACTSRRSTSRGTTSIRGDSRRRSDCSSDVTRSKYHRSRSSRGALVPRVRPTCRFALSFDRIDRARNDCRRSASFVIHSMLTSIASEQLFFRDQVPRRRVRVLAREVDARGLVGLVQQHADLRAFEERHRVVRV